MKSELRLIFRLLLHIIKLPFLFFLVLFRKRSFRELFNPIKDVWEFIYEKKITFYLIVINILVFILQIILISLKPESINQFIFQPEDLWNLNFTSIIVSWFLHAGFAHLIGNMIFLFIFGRMVEEEFGWNMLTIYFTSAVVADLTSALFGLGGIGASGAIAGLIGVGILLRPFYITYFFGGLPLPLFLVGWGALIADVTGVLIPQNTNVNHFAHLGGYLAVILIMFFASKENKSRMWSGLGINILILLLVVMINMVILQ